MLSEQNRAVGETREKIFAGLLDAFEIVVSALRASTRGTLRIWTGSIRSCAATETCECCSAVQNAISHNAFRGLRPRIFLDSQVFHSNCGSHVDRKDLSEALLLWSILQPKNKLQARPSVIYGADLYVDHPFRESGVADDVFIQIRGNPRRFLWPRNPKHAGGS